MQTGFWESGILEKWDFGKSGFWESGVSGKWDFGKVEYWGNGILGKCDIGIQFIIFLKNVNTKKQVIRYVTEPLHARHEKQT